MKRELTHRLYFVKARDRWICGCGYVLGDGHAKLYARCKFFGKRQPEASHENMISTPRAKDRKHAKSTKPPSKAQRQARSSGAGISKAAADLFNL